MKEIDLSTWERREIFECFSKDEMPIYGITTPFDVTNVYNFAKKNNISFYYTFGYILNKAIRSIEEFNIRIINGKLFVVDNNIVSFADLKKGEKLIQFVDVEDCDNVFEFCKNAKQILNNQKGLRSNLINPKFSVFFSCEPWFEFTEFHNPKSGNKDDFIPKIVWDRIKEDNGRKFVNLSIEVNHRIIDGLLVATLIDNANKFVEELK